MTLPPGVADPIFLCELAETLGMTIGDLGRRMSAHELTVVWPEFFAYKAREQKRQEEKEKERARFQR